MSGALDLDELERQHAAFLAPLEKNDGQEAFHAFVERMETDFPELLRLAALGQRAVAMEARATAAEARAAALAGSLLMLVGSSDHADNCPWTSDRSSDCDCGLNEARRLLREQGT